jgi:hypothetical protein
VHSFLTSAEAWVRFVTEDVGWSMASPVSVDGFAHVVEAVGSGGMGTVSPRIGSYLILYLYLLKSFIIPKSVCLFSHCDSVCVRLIGVIFQFCSSSWLSV